MSFLSRLFQALGLKKGNPSPILDELVQSIQAIADQEQKPVEEVVQELDMLLTIHFPHKGEFQRRWDRLTRREKQVVLLVLRNYTNRQIAAALVISQETVKSHIRNALSKLELHGKANLRQAASTWDFVQEEEDHLLSPDKNPHSSLPTKYS